MTQRRMIAWTIYLTFAGAVLLLFLPRAFARWIALSTAARGFAIWLSLHLFARQLPILLISRPSYSVPWVPALGMNYHLAVDGISLTMVLVTGITAVSAVLVFLGCR